jgi:hypothetical protein
MKRGESISKIFGTVLVVVIIGTMLPLGAFGSDSQVEASRASIRVRDGYPTITGEPTEATPWQKTIVDSDWACGFYPSLAFDRNGNPAISYHSEPGGIGGTLKYAHSNGISWSVQTVPDPDGAYSCGEHTSLAFDPSDNAAISYYDYTNGKLKYALWDGDNWEIETIASAGQPRTDTSLAFDASGNPAIAFCYCHYPWPGTDLKYAHWNGASWDIEMIQSIGDGNFEWFVSLAFDRLGNPAISYYDAANGYLKFAHFDGAHWQVGIVDSEGNVGIDNSLAFDYHGSPAISYHDWTNGVVKYAHWNGVSWDIEIIDSVYYRARSNSLAFDSRGEPAISYCNSVKGSELKYAHFDGTSWGIETVDTAWGYVSTAFDLEGNPGIAYCNEDMTLTYATHGSPDQPPTAYIDSISPNPANQGQAISFSGHGTDPDSGDSIAAYNWRSSIDGQLSTSSSFSKADLSSGTHTIYFKVRDSYDTWSTELTSALTINTTLSAKLAIISPLQMTPEKDKYYVGDLLTAKFTIQNVGGEPIIVDKLVVGGRFDDGKLPNGEYPDFSLQSITLSPGQSHQYEGTLELTEAGNYHFFCAYKIPDGEWNTSIDLGPGLTNEDRVNDIIVELPSGPYIFDIAPDSGLPGDIVTITGLNFPKGDFWTSRADVKFEGSYAEITSYNTDQTPNEIKCFVPEPRANPGQPDLQNREDKSVEVALYQYTIISNTKEFTYKQPVLESLNPLSGVPKSQVTLLGDGFGHEMGEYYYVRFGDSLADVISWASNEIVVRVPDDFGLGLGLAKDAFFLLTLAMSAAQEKTFDVALKLLIHLIPDLDLIKLDLKEGEPLISKWFKVALAIWAPGGLITVKPDGEIEVPVTVKTTIGESEPRTFIFSATDIEPLDIEDSLIAHLASPGELRIYDSQGRVTGLVSGGVMEEIPDSLYYNGIAVICSPLDSYTYEVVGTDDGTYGLEVTRVKQGQADSFATTDIPTASGAVHRYTIDWDSLTEGGQGVTVLIDLDGDGVFEATKTLRPPIASFTFSPSKVFVNKQINFDASQSSDADGEIVSYRWNFGDGNISTGQVVTQAYSAPGEYTVSLVVVDNDGVVSSYSRTIQVEERQGMPTWGWAIIAIGILVLAVIILRRRRPVKV